VTGAVASLSRSSSGGPRGSASAWPDDHTFLGKPTDSTIGLTLIGARPYDTALGRFVSVDPLLSQTDPQSLSGYAYANNNPQTLSDPTGLMTQKVNSGGTTSTAPATDPGNSTQSNNSGTSTSNTNQPDQPHTDHHWWDRASSGFHDVVCGIGNGLWYVGPGLVGSLERMGPGPINNWVADQIDATHDRLERWGGANVDSWTYRTGTATGFVAGTIATGGTSAAVRGAVVGSELGSRAVAVGVGTKLVGKYWAGRSGLSAVVKRVLKSPEGHGDLASLVKPALEQNLPEAATWFEVLGDTADSIATAGLESWPEAVIPYSSAVKVLPGQVTNGARQVVSRFSSDAGGSL